MGTRSRLGLAAVMLAGSGALATPALAENPFVSFLRGDWLRPRMVAPPPQIPRYQPPTYDTGLSITVTPRFGGGGTVAYCVRTCDGRYFPLSGVAPSDNRTAVERCQSFCPAAETRVYVSHDRSAGIDAAVSRDGQAYKAMTNAYAYRTSIDPSCRCNDAATLGMASLDIMDDPTLKPGDMVVTASGIKVFRGDSVLPHRERDFTPARADGRLPVATRRQIEAIEVASGVAP
ncbi:DUF2865 domain-containing protein [Ancylobacter sp. sgz301288]